MHRIFTIIIGFVVVLSLMVVHIIKIQNNSEIQVVTTQEPTQLFIATLKTEQEVEAIMYDTTTDKITQTKTFALEDYYGPNANNAWGENDAVQYNAKTQTIFSSETNKSEIFGCTASDGICNDTIYKTTWNNTQKTIVFRTEGEISKWILNATDNTIILIYSNKEGDKIAKVSTENGMVIFEKPYDPGSTQQQSKLVLSSDGQFTYQTTEEDSSPNDILRLKTINNTTGEWTESIITQSEWIETDTYISPDGKYVAYYGNTWDAPKLFLYNIATEKTTDVPFGEKITNFNLFWSGDSTELIQILDKGLVGYNINSKTSSIITEGAYIYTFRPANMHILLYDGDNDDALFQIYDRTTATKKTIPSTFLHPSEVLGAQWF